MSSREIFIIIIIFFFFRENVLTFRVKCLLKDISNEMSSLIFSEKKKFKCPLLGCDWHFKS